MMSDVIGYNTKNTTIGERDKSPFAVVRCRVCVSVLTVSAIEVVEIEVFQTVSGHEIGEFIRVKRHAYEALAV